VRLVLYDIPDKDTLCAALRDHERRTGPHGPLAAPILIGPGRLPKLPPAVSQPASPTPVWLWHGDVGTLRAAATEVLRRLVFPITHSPGPFCLAFPFPVSALAAQPLGAADAAGLDAEDIGRLLDGAAAGAPAGGRPRAPSERPRPAVQQDLDELQRRAVAHRGGALRVLAPAGSGKTKTMINRVAALVADGTPPGGIIVVAFNTKAAQQLEQRLGRLGVPTTRRVQDESGVHCATFNAFGYRYQHEIMRAAPQVSDDAAERARLMRASVWAALTEGAGAYAHEARSGSRPPQRGREAAALDDLAWRALDGLAQMQAALSDPASIDLPLPAVFANGRCSSLPFGEVERRFSDAQRRRSVQAFDDQISQAVLDMLAHPERRHALQDRYQHVLVDEFQDLNSAQLALVDILSRPHRRLFVVGDDDQLIYGWRFAQVENILGFTQRMPVAPHCETLILTTNYRCSREVVRRADMLIRHNARRVDKQIRCRADAPDGAVVLCAATDWRQRASALAGFLADSRTLHACAWSDLAVLSRYRAQLAPVAVALDAAGVPHTPLPGIRLFTLPAARLLHDCLTLVADASLGQEPLSHLAARLHLPEDELQGRARSLRRWLRVEHPTAHDGLEEVLRDLPLEKACPVRPTTDLRGAGRPDTEDGGPAIVLEAARLLSLDHGSLQSYLAAWAGWVAQEQAAEAHGVGPGSDNGVVISTIHAAKGREYRSVVIADFAVDLGSLTPAQVEEERRVLYVALTRAAETVLLTIDTRKRAPHQFVRELADPPSRELAFRLRRELARLGAPSTAASPNADPTSELQAAQLRLRGLELAGRLAEYQWFRPASRLRRAAGAIGLVGTSR
jgi:DNA helicase-2/ATP-dependent DNA helicase PcrA